MTGDLPIVDAHQHFWDPAGGRHPWLSTHPLPSFRYGDYSALRRCYFPEDFRRDAAGHRVVATVHMEAEWDPADEVGETRWLAGLRTAHGLPTVAIGHARFESPDVGEVLAGHAAFDFVRGIRQKPAAADSPATARRGAPGSMDDAAWRRGYALLERHGLHFDVQTPWTAARPPSSPGAARWRPRPPSRTSPSRSRGSANRTSRGPWSATGGRCAAPSPSSAWRAACSPATSRWTASASATARCSTPDRGHLTFAAAPWTMPGHMKHATPTTTVRTTRGTTPLATLSLT